MKRPTLVVVVLLSALGACGGGPPLAADADVQPDGDLCPVDSDGDSIGDEQEGWQTSLDTDGDGTPDWEDLDSDNDSLADAIESGDANPCTHPLDTDTDGRPDFQDIDADGDGILDSIEAGDDPLMPLDSDGDGDFDFVELDSDADGISDASEDLDLDGELDPGETSARLADTDGDGWLDLLEGAVGSDPRDPASGVPEDHLVFTLPHDSGGETVLPISATVATRVLDVFFELDASASMSSSIDPIVDALVDEIIPELSSALPDVAFGLGWFKDFPVDDFGAFPDVPFQLVERITTDVEAVTTAITYLPTTGGGQAESGMEALYQAMTGEGISWTVSVAGEVPPFDPAEGFDETKGHGLLGGAGFRAGALPVIVHVTDAEYNDGPEYWEAGILKAHTRDEAVAAAQARSARFMAATTSVTVRAALEDIARDTDAMLPPEAWGPGETLCHTGIVLEPDPSGLCPLVFDLGWGGTGLDSDFTDAVKALVTLGVDVSGRAVADPELLPALDTSLFIDFTPIPPAPPGSTIEGDHFVGVIPEATVAFDIHARNDITGVTESWQLFRTTIQIVGDNLVLVERVAWILLPPAN